MPPAADDTSLALACAADDRYAMPLAVAVRSFLDAVPDGVRVAVHVVDCGLRPTSRRKLEASWRRAETTISWVPFDTAPFAGARVSGHVSRASYARLGLGAFLPPSLERVLYLDADTLTVADPTPLFALDFGDAVAGAVPDLIAPTTGRTPAASWFLERGLDPDAPYFNAGVLLVDLGRWRREGWGERVIDCVRQHAGSLRWWDQDALNAVLAGRWLRLDRRWNVHVRDLDFPAPDDLDVSIAERDGLLRDPGILHFATHVKPWHADSRHPRRDLFFDVLSRTRWAGFRPRRASDADLAALRRRRERERLGVARFLWNAVRRRFARDRRGDRAR